MTKVYVLSGLGIGCEQEVAHAWRSAGADVEIRHINELFSGEKYLFNSQVINLPGGFLHGDLLGAGMCAANQLEHAVIRTGESRVKESLIDYSNKGGVIYGQCNGFQLLVKSGLLPGIDGKYEQQVTLTDNNCGSYRVAPTLHVPGKKHFAFEDIPGQGIYLWCRHGEGKLQFYSPTGLISKDKGEYNRLRVNENNVLLRYARPDNSHETEDFPYNPNGSVNGIAGLVSDNGHIFGHMAHTEVSVYSSRDPRWFAFKDKLRRKGTKVDGISAEQMEGCGLRVFRNIVNYFA